MFKIIKTREIIEQPKFGKYFRFKGHIGLCEREMVVFMAKKVKNVDVRAIEKAKVMEVIKSALVEAGYEYGESDVYGFAKEVIVVKGAVCDVQLKPIVPKAGQFRYEVASEEEDAE